MPAAAPRHGRGHRPHLPCSERVCQTRQMHQELLFLNKRPIKKKKIKPTDCWKEGTITLGAAASQKGTRGWEGWPCGMAGHVQPPGWEQRAGASH